MTCLTSFRVPVLVGFVLASSFRAAAEAPICSLLGMPFAPFFLETVAAEPVIPPMLLVPMVANLPFTADISYSVVLPDGSEGDTFKHLSSIARDRDGRVSVKSRGYRIQNAGRMAFSMEICDPVAGTTTSFQACVDGANDPTSSDGCAVKKMAHVQAGPDRRPDSGLPVFPDPFKPLPAHHSSAFVPRSGELVDLGEKDMEGVRVHGYRNVGGPQNSCKEWWLSEKTALEVSATTRRLAKAETEESPTSVPVKCLGGVTFELRNIQQVEPERELFQVPPDYEIVTIDNTWKGTVPWKPTVKPQ
jgi:hypothetical protein